MSVVSGRAVPQSDVEERLATASSPRFLGLVSGVVFDYELYDKNVLERDLQRVERFYRSRGYYDARARAARVTTGKASHVSVSIVVDEGQPVVVGDVAMPGLLDLPVDDASANALAAAYQALHEKLKPGRPFDEDDFVATEAALRRAFTENGYAYAQVKGDASVDLARRVADVSFDIKPGVEATFGPVSIEGLEDIPEKPVRRALALRRGAPFATSVLESAQRAAVDLGVFSSVEIEPDLSNPRSTVVPIRVRVAPTKLHTLRLGGGTEIDVIKTDVHLATGWEDRNFLGGLRKFSIDLKPGVVLFPTKLPSLETPTDYLPEWKARAELRQPGFIEPRTEGVLRTEFNIYPVLLSPKIDPGAPILGYRELKGAAGLNRRFGKYVYASLFYDVQGSFPFAYSGTKDDSLSRVYISYLDLTTNLDFRDDAIHPHKGVFLGNDLQLAGSFLQGDTTDVRVQPEIRAYAPISHKVTFAVRASTGFLFPKNYGETLDSEVPDGRDAQLVYFRAFFSGGPSSNRGYPFRGVGPHGAVPFFSPGLAAQALAQQCDDPSSPLYDSVRCAVPLGGLSLWEASAEIRFPLAGALSGATFCDASDVSSQRVDVRLSHPHLSCGLGLRYDTPVGPIRFDVGYRIPGLQVVPTYDPKVEGDPGTIFGAPIAIALGIGEAF